MYRATFSLPRQYRVVRGQLHAPPALPPPPPPRYPLDKRPDGPQSRPDDVEKTLPGLELRPLGRPPFSLSLHRQRDVRGHVAFRNFVHFFCLGLLSKESSTSEAF
jgi:hypothetical protein